MRSEQVLPVLATYEPAPADASFLREAAEFGVAHPKVQRLARAERAASGRARCRSCRELMEKGRFRLVLQMFEEGRMNAMGSIHPDCAEAYFGTTKILERLARLTPELDAAALVEIEEVMRVQRPAPPPEEGAAEDAEADTDAPA